jgi:flagellum-specific peptidoglycan hydrolase FlgJ
MPDPAGTGPASPRPSSRASSTPVSAAECLEASPGRFRHGPAVKFRPGLVVTVFAATATFTVSAGAYADPTPDPGSETATPAEPSADDDRTPDEPVPEPDPVELAPVDPVDIVPIEPELEPGEQPPMIVGPPPVIDIPIPDPSAQIAALTARAAANDAHARIAPAAADAHEADRRVHEARDRHAREQDRHSAAVRARDRLITARNAFTVDAYIGISGTAGTLFPTDVDGMLKVQRDQVLTEHVEIDLIARIRAAHRRVDSTGLAVERAASHVRAREFRAEAAHAVVAAVEAEAHALDREATRLEKIQAETRPRVSSSPPILGISALTPAQMAAWFRATSPVQHRYRIAPIEQVARWYFEVGADEGVRGDLAFVQAILETGWFTSQKVTQGNNPAGIGAYDRCAPACGFRFPSMEAGITAQIQLLRGYADPNLTNDQLARPLADRRVAPNTLSVRGCCATWADLTGVYATDPAYWPKVATLYKSMLEHTIRYENGT